MGTGFLPGVKRSGRGVDHPPHLAPWLKKEKSYTSTPIWAFVACSRVNFTFNVCNILLERYLVKDGNNFTLKRKYQMGRPRQNMLLSYLHQKEDGKQLKGMYVNRTKDYTSKVMASCFASHFPPEDLI